MQATDSFSCLRLKCHAGSISFEELDHHASAALEKFRVLSLLHHRSMRHMWQAQDARHLVPIACEAVMDKENCNVVGLELFTEGCKGLGYEDEEEVKELFEHLLLRGGSRSLALEDIEFLQSWEKTKRKKAERQRLGVRWVNRDPFLTARILDPSRSELVSEYSNKVSVDWEKAREPCRMRSRSKPSLWPRKGSMDRCWQGIPAAMKPHRRSGSSRASLWRASAPCRMPSRRSTPIRVASSLWRLSSKTADVDRGGVPSGRGTEPEVLPPW